LISDPKSSDRSSVNRATGETPVQQPSLTATYGRPGQDIRKGGRVVAFLPLGSATPGKLAQVRSIKDATPVRNVGAYARGPESDVEYRHRMQVNLFAALAVVVLLSIGAWVANAMVESQRVQGCYASGARHCSLI
jgi:hypothetical protein